MLVWTVRSDFKGPWMVRVWALGNDETRVDFAPLGRLSCGASTGSKPTIWRPSPRGSAASPKGEENAEHIRQTVRAHGSLGFTLRPSSRLPGRDVVELLCLKGSCYCKAGKLNLPIGHRLQTSGL